MNISFFKSSLLDHIDFFIIVFVGVCKGWEFGDLKIDWCCWGAVGAVLSMALLFGWPCLLTNAVFSVFKVCIVCL